VLTRTARLRLPPGGFFLCRIEREQDLPPPDPALLDVAILDMHHGWPNLGHDSLVRILGELTREIRPLLESAGFSVRALSYDVRARLMVPELPGERVRLYVGTGGPGHLDPRLNDGSAAWSQGIAENPAWEPEAFRLFDAVLEDPNAAFIGVCHTFGVLARWAKIARPVLRGESKGGKSSGVRENVLTPEAAAHPWFRSFSEGLPGGRTFHVMDSRLFDLLPVPGSYRKGTVPISFAEDALTAVEFARDAGGVVPRFFAVNHHPEIRDRNRQMILLTDKLQRGEVTEAWYEERVRIMDEVAGSPDIERSLQQTTEHMLTGLLRFHLHRLAHVRARDLGGDALG